MIIRSRAPLRIGFGGGGTDISPYSDEYGGAVLNATIAQYNNCTLEPREIAFGIEIVATDIGKHRHYELTDRISLGQGLDLHAAVYNKIVNQFNGGEPIPLKMTTYSDVPLGSGLGSSSTMVVTMVKAFAEYLNLPLGDYEIAHLAFEIERLDAQLSGGKQDHYAATFGGFNFIEFYADDHVIVNPLRVKNWIISELEACLVLFYTGASRSSARIIDQQVEKMNQSRDSTLASLHALKDQSYRMKEALLRGNIHAFGDAMNLSWSSKKCLADDISNEFIEEVYQRAIESGAWAGKISGAGGGGFLTFLVDPIRRLDVIRALESFPGRVLPCHFTKTGTQGWCLL